MGDNKRYWVDRDGNIYGPFNVQEDGFPNAGEVMQFYRILMNMSVKQCAVKLNVTPRRVQAMEKDNQVPDSMERRRLIAKTLQIPPVLLGLASVDAFLRPADVIGSSSVAASPARLHVDQKTIDQYQSQLGWFWSLHYTSSATGVQNEVQANIQRIQTLIGLTVGRNQAQLIEKLCGFYELAARVASDQNNADAALFYLNNAIVLAQPLSDDNAELYGRLLYKRGLVFYEARRFPEALVDLENANKLVPRLSSSLGGSILLELGVVTSYLAQPRSLTDISKTLRYFDQAEKYTRVQTDGGMGIRYDSGRYLTARGEGLIGLGKFTDAEDVLDESSSLTSPDLTRRHLFIDLNKIKLYVAQKDYPTATVLGQEVAKKAVAVGSLYSVRTLQEATSPLFKSSYGNSDEAQELIQEILKTKKKLL